MSNSLAGVQIGHATLDESHTGCTVFICPEGTIGGVDVRGPAPGSREIMLLSEQKSVTTINAIFFSGGSAFGLSTADGIMRYLAERDIGHPTPIRPIPIVAGAIVYDLFLGGGRVVPDAETGYAACLATQYTDVAQGNVGAGTGVTVGKWGGFETKMKGGFGMATATDGDLLVGAAAVVNSSGDVIGANGSVLAGAMEAEGYWLVDKDPYRRFPDSPPANLMTNTTLVLVSTNARLDKVGANRLAQRAHDGMAIAIRPVHTTHDGDAAFALSTGDVKAPFDLVAAIAVEVVTEAIRNGVRHAETRAGVPGLASLAT